MGGSKVSSLGPLPTLHNLILCLWSLGMFVGTALAAYQVPRTQPTRLDNKKTPCVRVCVCAKVYIHLLFFPVRGPYALDRGWAHAL